MIYSKMLMLFGTDNNNNNNNYNILIRHERGQRGVMSYTFLICYFQNITSSVLYIIQFEVI